MVCLLSGKDLGKTVFINTSFGVPLIVTTVEHHQLVWVKHDRGSTYHRSIFGSNLSL